MKEKANAEKVKRQANYKAAIGGQYKRFLGSMLCFLYTHTHNYMYFKPAPGSLITIQSLIVLDPAYKYSQKKIQAGNS